MQEPRLSGVQRMTAARVVGAVARLATGADPDMSMDRAVAELHAITTDPVPLGYALGIYLHRVETDSTDHQPAVDLLRAAGADEDTAAAKLAWLRWHADMDSRNWLRRKRQSGSPDDQSASR